MNDKKSSIVNFIGVYDNFITEEECDRAIKLFDDQEKFNNTLNRKLSEISHSIFKIDTQFFAGPSNLNVWWEELKTIIVNFDIALKHYIEETGCGEVFPELFFTDLKIQKTLPTQGYHVWHIEHGKDVDMQKRALVFSIYLNDVEEGGETEFLHFSKRVTPKKGRIIIWPSSFPYLHRGNPPLKGEKYILTSWMML